MRLPLHIIHLEDDPNDAALVKRILEVEGIACVATCVQSRSALLDAMRRDDIDLVLADYSLPGFNGLAALQIVRGERPDLPFIVVSGTMGEERAIDALHSGATDYVLKDRLARLVPAVRRAMQEVEDRAERQRTEQQLIEAQKMEVIGHLASGVAHDFNNILAVIRGYSDLISTRLDPDSPLQEYIEEIGCASERATALTQQLLVFGRNQRLEPVVLDLNEIVQGLNKMLRRLIGEHIAMKIITGAKLGRIKADSGYIGQVVMNLVVNARDAMPQGGQLIIATENVTLSAEDLSAQPGVTPGDYVMLAVSDTGVGMSDEDKARLFEPFFTTKPQGTGLGLATCQTIVRQCDGCITVESALGAGAIFRVYFPRVDQPLPPVTASSTPRAAPRGNETVLVVEDEPAVRHLASLVLENQGYTVLQANNGQDALHVAREYKGPPLRLVVTDLVMPQMGGQVMAEWLKATYPDLKFLFTSGYTDEAIGEHGSRGPGVKFLAKPYTPASLAFTVRELLDVP